MENFEQQSEMNIASELCVLGINLDDYYTSTEWDLLAVKAKKYEKFYPCCSEPYPDIKFNITIRRKTLFYTINLILPCVVICSVTVLLFYMPANSGEKITMGMTILTSLIILLLLVAEINPSTSLATPLIGKYLLFTMFLVTCSIVMTVVVLDLHMRDANSHVMAPWVKGLFLKVLPRLLFMQRPVHRIPLGSRYAKALFCFSCLVAFKVIILSYRPLYNVRIGYAMKHRVFTSYFPAFYTSLEAIHQKRLRCSGIETGPVV